MNDSKDDPNRKELLKSAYRKIGELRARLEAAENRQSEPVAVIGMGCRFPGGVTDADSYWQLLSSGTDGVTEIPPERWNVDEFYDPDPDAPSKMYVRRGGFVGNTRAFDPLFFHLSPQEASSMDPQQRLLLEVSWEAIENAGISADRLSGSATGVFVGISGADHHLIHAMNLENLVDASHSATGGSHSIAAGRLSYFLGLHGPCMAVDTACASALTALHLAVQSLRSGESKMALAGSVSLINLPTTHIVLCKARMLAADGKCKTFDAAADGYVRSEGCGILMLKLLSQAQADGDNILAVIRGTACNQDGRTNGITAPNGDAQQKVISAALADSGLSAHDIDYIETHGTGTSLGDPIELEALGKVFAPERPADRKLVLGAVKSNVGHMEQSAGIAAIIKVVLALQKAQIPPNLHLQKPNPLIQWDSLPFVLPNQLTPWVSNGNRRLAGVSSYGFSGTNIHMILEQAPPIKPTGVGQDRPCHLLTLSAQAPQALMELVDRYIAFLTANPNVNVGDVCATASTGRAHFSHRLAVVASTVDELKAKLARYREGTSSAGSMHTGRAPTQSPQLGFVIAVESFSEVHRQLYHSSPVFKTAIDACNAVAVEMSGQSSADLWKQPLPITSSSMLPSPSAKILAFALSYAMAAQWREWGVSPTAVSGSDSGSLVAAAFAGAISLRDALRLAVDPKSTHSEAVAWSPPQTALLSATTGSALTLNSLTGSTERADSVKLLKGLKEEGIRVLLTIGTLPDLFSSDAGVASIAGSVNSWSGLLNVLGELYIAGVSIDWQKFERQWPHQRLALPTYPFQRQDCSLKLKPGSNRRRTEQKDLHPLLGRRVYSARLHDEIVFEAEFDTDRLPLLKDHSFFSTVVVPAAGMLEMGNTAGRVAFGKSEVSLDEFVIEQPLLLHDGQPCLVQTVLTPAKTGRYTFVIMSAEIDKLESATPWKRHCSGILSTVPAAPVSPADPGIINRLLASYDEPIDTDWFYETIAATGTHYGPTFRVMRSIGRGDDGTMVHVQLNAETARQSTEYGMYPGLLDAVLQALGTAYRYSAEQLARKELFMPIAVGHYQLSMLGLSEFWCHSSIRSVDDKAEMFLGDVTFYTTTGQLAGEMRGVHFKRNVKKQFVQEMDERRLTKWLFEPRWDPIPTLAPVETIKGTWLIVSNGTPIADEFANVIKQRHGRVIFARSGQAFSQKQDGSFTSRFDSTGEVNQLIRAAIDSNGQLRGVVYFASSSRDEMNGSQSVPRLAGSRTEQLLHLTLALANNGVSDLAALAVVTEGFQNPNIGIDSSFGGSAAWGLGRTIAAELPDLHCRMIDLQRSLPTRKAAELLADEVGSESDENQVALDEGKRHGLRLTHADASIFGRENSLIVDSRGGIEMDFAARGDFRELRFVPQQAKPPGDGEVQLRLLATALNFRDVLNVLGMYPGDPGPVGVECVGEIVALGANVSNWSIGDHVLAMPRRGYCTYTTARADMIFRRPENLSIADSATLLVAYLTAAYSLHHLGQMKAGDRVLIHAAAGGVGLAAVQLAQQAGAEIFATAGSPAKREYLRKLGVKHVMDSRSLGFAKEIRELTNGQGIDLVLNSLTGQAIQDSLSLLRTGGCFLEIGKNELLSKEQLASINAGAKYYVIDLADPYRDEPEVLPQLFQSLTESLAAGTLRPLPHRTFNLSNAPQAFRYMAAAKHIGKVIVLHPPAAATALEAAGTYLITGGLGGLGLQVAKWMVSEGARRIVLTGRSAPSPAAENIIKELESLGATIVVARADIGDLEQVSNLLKEHTFPSAPLRGIIHAAGVLDDGALLLQDWQRFERVMKPKIDGAWNLHELTLHMPLDFFVMFSSGAGLLGNPGQSGYAAGNVFLDELAVARQAAGLPALSINWGAWAEVGMAAAMNERHTKGWDSRHLPTIDPSQGITIMQMLMAKNQIAQMAVLPIEESVWREAARHAVPPLIKNLVIVTAQAEPAAPTPSNTGQAAERLRQAAPENKREVLIALIHEMVLDVFGVDRRASIPPDQNLTTLGMDSLLAIQLSNRLKTSFSAAVPPTLTFQYPTTEAIADYLIGILAAVEQQPAAKEVLAPPEAGDAAEALDPRKAEAILANLDQLSPAQVEELLGAMSGEDDFA